MNNEETTYLVEDDLEEEEAPRNQDFIQQINSKILAP